MGLRVNFSDTETRDFSPIPPGVYTALVTDGELREAGPNAKHPGSQYINWEFTIQDEPHVGRKQWMNTSLVPDALFGLKDLLAATGKFEVDGELDFDIADVIGSEVKIKVKTKTYDGELQNEVKRVMSASSDEGTSGSSLLP